MLLLAVWALWLRWRGELFRSRLFLRFATLMGPAGLVAILAGWFTTEIGRQPWVVYGVMRTEHAVSNHSALTHERNARSCSLSCISSSSASAPATC